MFNKDHTCVIFRRNANRQRAYEQLEKLKDSLQVQHFMQDCDELSEWLGDKMIAAQDETYRDAKNIHSKYMRHQAFESEIAANKDRLNKLIQVNITFSRWNLYLYYCNIITEQSAFPWDMTMIMKMPSKIKPKASYVTGTDPGP